VFSTFLECSQTFGVFCHSVIHVLGFFICFFVVEVVWRKTIKVTCFFYVFYYDKTWTFDQSEHVQGPIYIIMFLTCTCKVCQLICFASQSTVRFSSTTSLWTLSVVRLSPQSIQQQERKYVM